MRRRPLICRVPYLDQTRKRGRPHLESGEEPRGQICRCPQTLIPGVGLGLLIQSKETAFAETWSSGGAAGEIQGASALHEDEGPRHGDRKTALLLVFTTQF